MTPGLDLSRTFDVLVVGGGNAALCAAMTAREAGADVLLLECSPRDFRGGNSRHTRNMRYVHARGNHYLTGPYLEDEFRDDLRRVTGSGINEQLARMTLKKSENLGAWVEGRGGVFQPSMRGTLHLSRTNAFFLGGGKALMNAYYATAARLGVGILYEAEATDLDIREDGFVSAAVLYQGVCETVRAGAVVVASGGFQANIEWLREYWGPAADRFIVRGTPYDQGRMLRVLLDRGARPVGDPRSFHGVAIDARAPRFDGGIVTRLDVVPFGIVVNKEARRFYDEGEEFWPKRYAIWGRLVAGQPDQVAYSIIDSKSMGLFMPSVFPPFEAGSIREMAGLLDIDPDTLEETVAGFNRSTTNLDRFDPAILDECHTRDLTPPKSHWARALDTPPFYGYPLRPGITFTYLGVAVDERARVLKTDERPWPNVFAAGEIMSGNILDKGYLAGFGMTIGTVFGRIAGKEAARHISR
ncbi:MAG: FAD-dependent tricarballylate dehydrogenase TcuA [Proteobacteria bacterium]|nr:FAD-dependent tricarballylate dehydrogenase TcuA [Pseudomonadota bacterium]